MLYMNERHICINYRFYGLIVIYVYFSVITYIKEATIDKSYQTNLLPAVTVLISPVMAQ